MAPVTPTPSPTKQVKPKPTLVRYAIGSPPEDFIQGLKRGMIIWAAVRQPEAKGSEIFKATPRPWIIVSKDELHQKLPIVQAVACTHHDSTKLSGYRNHRIELLENDFERFADSGLDSKQLVEAEQLRILAHARIEAVVGVVNERPLDDIGAALMYVLDL